MKRKNIKLNLLHHVPYSGSLNNSIAASAPLTLSTAPSRTVFYEGMIVFTVSYTTAVAFKSFVFFFRLHGHSFILSSSHSFRLSHFHAINILLVFFRINLFCLSPYLYAYVLVYLYCTFPLRRYSHQV